MRIHLTGTNWHAATTQNLKKAFEALGHEVLFFDKHLPRNWKIAQNLAHRATRRPYKVENYFFKITSGKWLKSIELFKPDLIIIEDAPNILAEYIAKAKKEIGCPIFYYEISPPQGAGARDVLFGFKYVDEVFCIDREWAKYIEIFFPGKIRHLPLAGNPDDFYPVPDEKKIYDVAMVASAPEQTPDGLIRANLMNEIPKNLRVGIFGSGWQYWTRYFPDLAKCIGSSSVPSIAEVNRIYNQSKILINFHSTGHLASISSRTFEIALAGGFQLLDYREDLDLLFPPKSFSLFGSPAEMVDQIRYWLNHPEERTASVKKTHDIVLKNHTWQKRIEKIIGVYRNASEK